MKGHLLAGVQWVLKSKRWVSNTNVDDRKGVTEGEAWVGGSKIEEVERKGRTDPPKPRLAHHISPLLVGIPAPPNVALGAQLAPFTIPFRAFASFRAVLRKSNSS